MSYAELASQTEPTVDWLWHGYLAAGNVTLLTAQWKTGKTTLLSVLLAKLASGGDLAGLNVRPGRAAIVTEESPQHWRLRGERLTFGPEAKFVCRPFVDKPNSDEWRGLIDYLADLNVKRNIDLVAFDTLAALSPAGTESHSQGALAALRPLEQLTRSGMSVLLLHHPRKNRSLSGQASRGSGALCAYADILIEMNTFDSSRPDDRRRKLFGWSRHDATVRERVIELSPDGRDYVERPDALDDDAISDGLECVRDVLASADVQLTLENIAGLWPKRMQPSVASLHRWLTMAFERQLVVREGAGVRGDPYRYALPGRKLEWRRRRKIFSHGWRGVEAGEVAIASNENPGLTRWARMFRRNVPAARPVDRPAKR
jgi:hypothetical protein